MRGGAPEGANRSDTFHGVVGHYLGCGWTIEHIIAHLEEFPDGIGNRYIAEGRLAREVRRSAAAFGAADPAPDKSWSNGFPKEDEEEQLQSAKDPPDAGDEEEQAEPELPPMFAHGDPDPRPIKAWAIKDLLLTQGHGLLAGQWGTFKSFIALELAGCLMTGQPFLDRLIKRQCGVLFLAAEGQHETRLLALVQEKCGRMNRAPFRWFEDVPVLLQPDSLNLLVAMDLPAVSPYRWPSPASRHHACLCRKSRPLGHPPPRRRQHASDLGFQFRRAFLHALITHRFMFRRIGFDLRAIQCDVAEFDQPCCLAQLQNLEEQLAERLQMALAEVADRSEVRRIERDNHHEIVPLAAGSSNAPRRIQPACIAVQQKRNHHARIERRLAQPTHIAAHDRLEIQASPAPAQR